MLLLVINKLCYSNMLNVSRASFSNDDFDNAGYVDSDSFTEKWMDSRSSPEAHPHRSGAGADAYSRQARQQLIADAFIDGDPMYPG